MVTHMTATYPAKLNLALAVLFILPLLNLVYRFASPLSPFLIIDFGNRVDNALFGMYLLFPCVCATIAFLRGEQRFTKLWAAVAIPCAIGALLWMSWTWQMANNYQNPEIRLKSTLMDHDGVSIKHYETVTGAYLTEERVILPGIRIGKDLKCLDNGFDVKLLSQTKALCVSESGKSTILDLRD